MTLGPAQTVAEAHAAVRAAARHDVRYLYVLDEQERLAGVVAARRLLTAQPDERVEQVMEAHVVAIPSWATVLVASEYFVTRKQIRAFPVIHDDGRLAGTVDIDLFTDEVIQVAQRTYDDIYQLLGVHATAMRTPWTSFVDRFPWLLSNIAGGLVCAVIAAQFEELLQQAVVLALFIPIVLALGESVSMQSATLTLQSLSDEALTPRRIAAALWKEIRTAALLGLSCAVVVSVVVLAWRRDVFGAAVIGGAIAASFLTACGFGVLLPTVVRACKADPRIAAGPLVLAATDILTLVFYLGLGTFAFGR